MEDAQVWREKSELDENDPKDSGKAFDFREKLWGALGRTVLGLPGTSQSSRIQEA